MIEPRRVSSGSAAKRPPCMIQVQVESFAALSVRARKWSKRSSNSLQKDSLMKKSPQQLTARGHRSPMRQQVLPSTVKTIRLKHGIMIKRHQSHPRRIDGFLTVPQLAKKLGITAHFIYDRIHNGTIEIVKDQATRLYLFPDRTCDHQAIPKADRWPPQELAFLKEHQHARSKQLLISPSKIYCAEAERESRIKHCSIASATDRIFRNPYECGSAVVSAIGSRASRCSACRARSSIVGMPSGRIFVPFGSLTLGM